MKAAGFVGRFALEYEWHLDSPLEDSCSVGGGEPLVFLDVVDACLRVAEPLGQFDSP